MQDFRIETFLTVCQTLNFTKAAELLHITQPAVSQHIHFLETHYKAVLFTYEGKKLYLTKAGRMLQNAVTTMKHDEMILMDALQQKEQQSLIFGATLTIGDFVLPERIAGYIEKHPDTEVRMLVDNTETLLAKIDTGELDFAIIEGYFQKAEYESFLVSKQPYIAVCSDSYKFRKEPWVLSDLYQERLLLREPGSGTREILERHIMERNGSVLDFSKRTEIGSISAIKTMLALNCGITFLYKAAVEKELLNGSLREIPLKDFVINHQFTMVYRKQSIFQERYKSIFRDLF